MTKMWEIFLFFLSRKSRICCRFLGKVFHRNGIKSKKWYKGFKNDVWPYTVDDSKNLWNSKKNEIKIGQNILVFHKNVQKNDENKSLFSWRRKNRVFFGKKYFLNIFGLALTILEISTKSIFTQNALLNETFYIFCFFF